MKLTVLAVVGLVFMTGSIGSAAAEASGNGWAGEWGTFARISPANGIAEHYEGAGLSVTNCSGEQCKVAFEILGRTSRGAAKGELLIQGDSRAVAQLTYGTEVKCVLAMEKTGSEQPSIIAKRKDGDCSFFVTPGASFERDYVLRSPTPFYADDIPACFVGEGRAWAALCASQALSRQEHDWKLLVWEVSDLISAPGKSGADENAERTRILQSCDAAPDAGTCLANAFAESTGDLNARKDAWKASVTEPGEADAATRAIDAIAGTWRHSFPNGDVQGDKFQSTDTLEIKRVSDTSIQIDVHLEFFNGHECNHKGVASYRRGGIFAEQVRDGQGRLCVLEVVPTGTGVQLADPTGMCRMSDCGARGGYNGAAFSWKDRVKSDSPRQESTDSR